VSPLDRIAGATTSTGTSLRALGTSMLDIAREGW
jgi:hypothetical protein